MSSITSEFVGLMFIHPVEKDNVKYTTDKHLPPVFVIYMYAVIALSSVSQKS
jgi:hypothetical protein